MSITTEQTFESAIVDHFIQHGHYTQGNAPDYSPELGMFKYDVIAFLQQSQPQAWEKITAVHGPEADNRVIQRLFKELELRGALDVLRNGFVDYGVRFRMAFFKPETGLNQQTIELYEINQLKIVRQLYYTHKNKNSVDLVISLNGLPIATLEIKNHFTGQTAENAKKQYATTRDNKELLFAFKKRALVHFAVDPDEVFMTSKIDGDRTHWLPFNRGCNQGKGNPANPNGYKTAYLWENILGRDSLLDILHRFVHLQVEEYEFDGVVQKKEKLIFPRYHQLDAVRCITSHARQHGAGQNYLIQHSAGSGKSNSIAWLAYRLSSLHNQNDERVFNSVIVVTDRRVLDQQLQNTIYQFEHKTGVVQKIDQDSNQLANAIISGTHIIITTLFKFPFVIDKVGSIPDRKYAVIIDEAHSSQGGEASKKMKEVLAVKNNVETGYTLSPETDPEPEFDMQDEIDAQVEKSCQSRGRQQNISFFAFTATPKPKTLGVFGQPNSQGKPEPFHLYSMRQAIEEGFIHDVLANYTTYERYFKLSKAISDDPELNKKKASKAIGRFVSLHPHELAQKTEVIVEHFRQIVSKKIGARAKAMVVTGSRLHAKRYFTEFNNYIKANNYQDIRVLVAFSGKVADTDYPYGVSEPELTGYGEKELPQVFEKDDYKILIVADKYQTGFDQPLLHTMYVDKVLTGVKAVQTLSRLNRTCPGKEDTFVLDFVNDRDTILQAFQPYYQRTSVVDNPDPNHLYDLKNILDAKQVYWQSEIEAFANIYFKPGQRLSLKDQAALYAHIDPAVDRFKALQTDEEKDEFKKGLRTWCNLYSFLSQIMPFFDSDFEKFFAFAKLLQTKLPKRDLSETLQLTDELAMDYYRLEKIQEGAIELQKNDGELDGFSEAGIKRPKEDKAPLSQIINILNDRFGTEFTEADRLFFDQMEADLVLDDKLRLQAQANDIGSFKYAFDDLFLSKLIERMDQNQEIFEKILENKAFGGIVKDMLMQSVYTKLNAYF
ncbi:MAG: type I restriction endonuclease subunit R [Marinilabiliaceae bacterium]|nr:type I restriction endonuclease subunit R [Marinilabiliaceae bacterium]